jgi:4-hydroxybenzoate polyprenyltransferase
VSSIFRFAFRVSRFRFWIYLAGTYVVGYALGMDSWRDFLSPAYIAFMLYFFLPANVLLYGVNDYWDEKTDRNNPKKSEKEYLVNREERGRLLKVVTAAAIISLVLLVAQRNMVGRAIFLTFLGLSYFYSAEPLRFKSKPFLDFASNSLYLMPGILGYFQASGGLPILPIVIAGVMHTSAMHLFSAIPDIAYDRQAGVKTTAVLLERRFSLLLCFAFWTVLAVLGIHLTGYSPFSLVILVYPVIPLALLIKESLNIDSIYWYWPYVNTAMGGVLFLVLTLDKIGIL